jgi:hypothetical protein
LLPSEQFVLSGVQRYKIHIGMWHLEVSMSDTTTIGLDRPEEEILTYEVSDEGLETAAGMGNKQAGNNTLVCTFFYICPI